MSEINSLKDCEWEAIIDSSINDSISMDNEINAPQSSEKHSFIARLICNKRQAIISASSPKSIKEELLKAKKIARLMPINEDLPIIKSQAKFKKKEINYNYFNEKKLIESCEEIKSLINAKANIMDFSISKSICKARYINHLGANIEIENDSISYSLNIGEGDRTGSDYSMLSRKKPCMALLAKNALQKYDWAKNTAKAKTNDYSVVFCHEAALCAMQPIFFSLKGCNAYEKKSRYENSIGKRELSEKLTIIDNPNEANNKSYFDFEGNRAKKTILSQNGIIKSFIHDEFTSEKLKMKNTNNSASLAIKPSTEYHCLQIKGDEKLSQMIKETKEGFIFYDLYPSHAINDTTGAFGLNSSSGYYIKNGEIIGAAKGCAVTANSYEIFKKGIQISKETRNDIGANIGAIKSKARIISP